ECRMTAPAEGSDVRLRMNDPFSEAVVIVDFQPRPQKGGRLGVTFRCHNGCLDVGVYPDGTYFVSEKVGSMGTYKDIVDKKGEPLPTTRPSRLTVALQSQQVKLWLNGHLLTTATTTVAEADGP